MGSTTGLMLNEDELPLNERKGSFGVVYLRAIAAIAGYGVSLPETDYDSIDLKVSSRRARRPQLDFQVKCTAQDVPSGEDFPLRYRRRTTMTFGSIP
jgi:hypothetical protein